MTSTTRPFETVRHALGQVSVVEEDLLVSACVIPTTASCIAVRAAEQRRSAPAA